MPFLTLFVILVWWLNTPEGVFGKTEAVAYSVCHRIESRSFHFGERVLPLCARCSGMYLGVVAAWLYYRIRKPRAGYYPPLWVMLVLGSFAVIWAADGFNSFLHLLPDAPRFYSPSNLGRLITGTLMGVAMMTGVYPMFNQLAWKEWKSERVLASWQDLVQLLLVAAVPVLLVLTEAPQLLYPLAILSSGGVLLLLTLVYSAMILNVRGYNQAQNWRQLWLPLALGLALAFIQIGLLDWMRFGLTGTWSGLHF